MTDGNLYYTYQADGYQKHHPTLIRAASEEAAKERHRELWRDMFDKPADAEPHDSTYTKVVEPDEINEGEVLRL